MTNSRPPLPPDPGAVEQRYGEDAELYAEVRAETAAATRLEKGSEEWRNVQAEIERIEDHRDQPSGPGESHK